MQLVWDELSPVIERLGAGHRCVAPRSKCYQPLFTAFGPKAIEHRLKISDAKLVVTDIENRSKLDEANCKLPVLSVTSSGEITIGDLDFHSELARQPRDFSPVMRRVAPPRPRLAQPAVASRCAVSQHFSCILPPHFGHCDKII
jgi:hypothetical protein